VCTTGKQAHNTKHDKHTSLWQKIYMSFVNNNVLFNNLITIIFLDFVADRESFEPQNFAKPTNNIFFCVLIVFVKAKNNFLLASSK
jgi:hypothetical protein